MQCNKCKTKYYSKLCPKCNNLPINNKVNIFKKTTKTKIFSEQIKKKEFRKKLNIPMIIIATAIVIIALILIKKEYVEYQQNKQIAKLLYGTDDYDEIEKINKKLMIQNEKTMKQLRELYIPK